MRLYMMDLTESLPRINSSLGPKARAGKELVQKLVQRYGIRDKRQAFGRFKVDLGRSSTVPRPA